MKPLLLVTLIFAIATIPLAHNLNSIAVISFVTACFLQQRPSLVPKRLAQSKFWLLPVAYFCWIACSYFWDISGGYNNRNIERYAILFFMPLALASVPRLKYNYIRYACGAFIAVTVVICLLCLIKSYTEYSRTGDYRVFYYHYLAQQMSLNAIFLSNFCLASIVWLFYFGKEKLNIAVLILIGLFLVGMLFLLSSKMILLLLMLFIPAYFIYTQRRKINIGKVSVLLLLLAAGVYMAVQKLPYLKWRIAETEIKTYQGTADNNNGIAIRLYMWKTGWKMIRERPLLGYGLKGARDETLRRYQQDKFELGYANNYHTHNQYIESTIMAGLPALLLLLSIIAMALKKGFDEANLLLITGTLHFALHSIIESTFEVQQEQVFFMFFIFLFYFHPPQPTNEKANA